MDKYIEAELRLAGMLGWKNIRSAEFKPDQLIGRVDGDKEYVPAWTSDNGAAFALMVEHSCYPKEHAFGIECDGIKVVISNHPTKEIAVRYAIVMAVIAKLEAK